MPGKPLTWGTGVGNNEAAVTLYLWADSVDMAGADSVDRGRQGRHGWDMQYGHDQSR